MNKEEKRYQIEKVKKYDELIKEQSKLAAIRTIGSSALALSTIRLLMLRDKILFLNDPKTTAVATLLTAVSAAYGAFLTSALAENIQTKSILKVEKANLEFDLEYEDNESKEPKVLRK